METEQTESRLLRDDERVIDDGLLEDEDPLASKEDEEFTRGSALDRSTKRKLDFVLLPFLALLFLLNSVDKSNIGNAETAGFTTDAGLAPGDLNVSMGFFFAFFVALQPVGAALGRKFGMVRWVPACMSLWGLCTLLHIWVRAKWQLILLRITIAILESGFYPTTVAYLSLFYTRYEFAVRLSLFYGQTAVAGVIGGVLSWAVFSGYETRPGQDAPEEHGGLRGWQVLFLLEGCLTMAVALLGFFWLPRSADTAWFFNDRQKIWAEKRIRMDYQDASIFNNASRTPDSRSSSHGQEDPLVRQPSTSRYDPDTHPDEAHRRLLNETHPPEPSTPPNSLTAHAGLTKTDILTAFLSPKIYHLLAVNILSSIPATAFSIFLPLVITQLSPSLNLRPSESNLLSAPPFAFGATLLFLFARWSDKRRTRLVPILVGLAILLVGLTLTVLVPLSSYILRYAALCLLLSGSFIASPLTVAWITNNTPEPGKRAVLLGINGWGNLAGVFLSVLFTPKDRVNGYVRPFVITLLCAVASFAGYVVFYVLLWRENRWRERVVGGWSEEEREREGRCGDVRIPMSRGMVLLLRLRRWAGLEEARVGDERLTFRYGL
ncbi:major facilitator superfamily domain-containing protein [Neohortaea acidophila]|uniref:Major facilitator superfamily domain-containing protein n=1 Tax=Neohortaea acidophila TaxID=245834 RepID=A0A6A6PVI8_9PEZI|nr:major facilitator superfamily domain-containing protein [Neohortaea acidophila]KAF2484168.1 major facilitator superfamily domain-containing protein [Neohortaea acidophila]